MLQVSSYGSTIQVSNKSCFEGYVGDASEGVQLCVMDYPMQ